MAQPKLPRPDDVPEQNKACGNAGLLRRSIRARHKLENEKGTPQVFPAALLDANNRARITNFTGMKPRRPCQGRKVFGTAEMFSGPWRCAAKPQRTSFANAVFGDAVFFWLPQAASVGGLQTGLNLRLD